MLESTEYTGLSNDIKSQFNSIAQLFKKIYIFSVYLINNLKNKKPASVSAVDRPRVSASFKNICGVAKGEVAIIRLMDPAVRSAEVHGCTDACLVIIHPNAPVCKDGIFHNFFSCKLSK